MFQFLTIADERKRLLTVTSLRSKVNPVVVFTICLLLYPVLGWLGDVRHGRYLVIKWSLRVMWVGSIVFCLADVVLGSLYSRSVLSSHQFARAERTVRFVMYMPITLGLGGFLANIFQFVIDQLVDASSEEIASFLRWHAWVWFLSGNVCGLSQLCVNASYELIGYLALPFFATVAVSSDCVLNHWLIKEPTSKNPFIMIFRVLRYAMKNKYPRLRSAFTYWDDKPYRRIDLAKAKFGGPYTTEQVEDVKTFFRIVSVVIAGTFFISLFISMYPVYDKILYRLRDQYKVKHAEYSALSNCFQGVAVRYSGDCVMVVFLPLCEFVIYPFAKRFVQLSILKRFVLGLVCLLLSLLSCTIIELVAQQEAGQIENSCPLTVNEQSWTNTLPLDYRWMIISYMTLSFAQYLLLTATTEFLCAQSPHSMRGLLVGFTFGSMGFFAILGYSLLLPLQLLVEKKLSFRYGCVFWYLVLCAAMLMAVLTVFLLAFKCYRKRSRDDNEHNEQIFAVNYYSECHDST